MIRDDYIAIQREIEKRLENQKKTCELEAKKERKKARIRFWIAMGVDIVVFFVLASLSGNVLPLALYVILLLGSLAMVPYMIVRHIRARIDARDSLQTDIRYARDAAQNDFNSLIFNDYTTRVLLGNGFCPTEIKADGTPVPNAKLPLNRYEALYQNVPYTYKEVDYCGNISLRGERKSDFHRYSCITLPVFKQLDDNADVVITRLYCSELNLAPKGQWRSFSLTPCVSVDNSSFKKAFEVHSMSAFEAFKILTPTLMEKLLTLNSQYPLEYLAFNGDTATIVLKHPYPEFTNYQNGFDVDEAMRNAQEQAETFTNLMKSISFLGRKINV